MMNKRTKFVMVVKTVTRTQVIEVDDSMTDDEIIKKAQIADNWTKHETKFEVEE